jgi:predicted Zn-dependent protease
MRRRVVRRGRVPVPRVKPVFVMSEEGVTGNEIGAVTDGLHTILREAGVDGKVEVRNFGVWRHGKGDYESVDWYVAQGRKHGRQTKSFGRQLNASSIMSMLSNEPWRRQEDHYDLFVCSSDLWQGRANNNFVIGLAQPFVGTVLSVRRFREPGIAYGCIKTETIHEMGHVFGLIPHSREDNVEYSLGKHCTNLCTMRQGLSVPADWVRITADRDTYGTFCPICSEDLKGFFRGRK